MFHVQLVCGGQTCDARRYSHTETLRITHANATESYLGAEHVGIKATGNGIIP